MAQAMAETEEKATPGEKERKLIDTQREEVVKEANDRRHGDDKEALEAAGAAGGVQATDKTGEDTRKAYGGLDGILDAGSAGDATDGKPEEKVAAPQITPDSTAAPTALDEKSA